MKKTPLSIVKRDLSNQESLQEISANDFAITKPTLIVLDENYVKRPQDLKNILEVASSLVGLKSLKTRGVLNHQNVDVIGVSYGELDGQRDYTAVTTKEINSLVDSLLMPLALDSSGQKIQLSQAQGNFGNVNFFSHGYGTMVINAMLSSLGQKMLSAGYNPQEILQIEQQMTSVSYGPVAEVYNIPSLQIVSAKDGMSMLPDGASAEFMQLYYNVVRGNTKFSGNKLFKEDENTVTLFTSNMSLYPTNEHSITLLERSEFGEYTTLNGANADAVSKVASKVLTQALEIGVENSQTKNAVLKPTADDMLNLGQSVLEKMPLAPISDYEA